MADLYISLRKMQRKKCNKNTENRRPPRRAAAPAVLRYEIHKPPLNPRACPFSRAAGRKPVAPREGNPSRRDKEVTRAGKETRQPPPRHPRDGARPTGGGCPATLPKGCRPSKQDLCRPLPKPLRRPRLPKKSRIYDYFYMNQ